MVLTEGWDMPAVGCCILARPTKQIGLYLQMIGRVLRPAEGKERAIILDHSGGVYRHGRPEDRIEWTLDVDARAVNKEQERRKRGEAMKVRECPSCQHVLTVVPCWQCGWEPKPYSRGIDFADGELGLVEKGVAEQASLSRDQKQDFYRELLYIQAERKYKTGWAAHQFKEKCGQFPPWLWNDFAHKEPGTFTLGWVRHRQIAYAKRRRAA
jgi:superfamily II DNA or RNA helicase